MVSADTTVPVPATGSGPSEVVRYAITGPSIGGEVVYKNSSDSRDYVVIDVRNTETGATSTYAIRKDNLDYKKLGNDPIKLGDKIIASYSTTTPEFMFNRHFLPTNFSKVGTGEVIHFGITSQPLRNHVTELKSTKPSLSDQDQQETGGDTGKIIDVMNTKGVTNPYNYYVNNPSPWYAPYALNYYNYDWSGAPRESFFRSLNYYGILTGKPFKRI